MGRDKALEEIDGKPLLEYVAHALSSLTDDIVLVESPGASRLLPELGQNVRRVVDDPPNRGPLGGLQAGLAASRSDAAWVVACDMPFVDGRLLTHMAGAIDGWDAVVPVWKGRNQPVCAMYSMSILPKISELLGGADVSMQALIRAIRTRNLSEDELLTMGVTDEAFLNVNAEIDLERVRELLQSRS